MDEEEFKRGFARTENRGPDMSRGRNVDGGVMGFRRLAIMGLDES